MGKELATTQLIDYLKKVVELEASVFSQETVLQNAIGKNIRKNVQKQKIQKPVRETIEKPVEPKSPATGIPGLFITFLVMGVLSLIVGPTCCATGASNFLGGLLSVIGLILSGIGAGLIVSEKKTDNEARVKYNQEMAKYPEVLKQWEQQSEVCEREYVEAEKQYKKACDDATEKYQLDIATANETYENGRKMVVKLEQSLSETKHVLEEYYALDVIFPKYRSFIAVSSFLEYLETGRCTELAGPNGCYNLFESELRQNIIIGQLGTVINQLEQVKQNQFVLYQEIQKANNEMATMNMQLNDITTLSKQTALNTAVTSYCAEITAQNTAMMAGMMMYS